MYSICQVFVKYNADAMLIDAGVGDIVGRRQTKSTKTETDLESFTRIYLSVKRSALIKNDHGEPAY